MLPTLLLKLALLACVGAQSQVLHFSFVSTDSSAATDLTPPLNIALDIINNSSTILPGYQLNVVPWLSECDRTLSLNRFLDVVLERCNDSTGGDTILGVVGCGCTEANLPVAELIHRWNIPQISYVGESSMMIDREQYPNYFLLHSMETVGRALQAILSEYEWTRLAVITTNSTRFLEMGKTIRTVLEETGQNVTQNHTIVDPNTIQETLDMLATEYRIFFLNTFPETAREIFCNAIELRLEFPRYVWIINGWYPTDWWVTMDTTGCSNADVEQFLQSSRVLVIQPYQISNDLIIGGITRAEYYRRYEATVQASGTQYVPEHALIYDSVWTLALALNSTLANRNPVSNSTCDSGLSLENFSYTSEGLGREIRAAVSRTSFNGASGEVTFDLNGIRRQDTVAVLQYRNGEDLVEIGSVDVNVSSTGPYNFTYAANQNSSTVFPGIVPMDGTPLKIIITFDVWIVGVCYTLAVIGLIFTFICFLFNIIFRKRKIVRLTSPNLNYFILLGSVLVYSTIFVYLIRTTDRQVYKVRCYIQAWTVTLGFMLAFGTVIAKLYRIVHIFKNPSPDRTKLKDWKLMIIIALFVLYGLALLLLRLIVPQFRVEPSLASNRDNPNGLNELGIVETYCSWRCIGENPVPFYYQIVYYFCVLVVLVLALVFALRTRKVKIKVLNDAKWISAIVYVSAPATVLFFVLSFVIGAWVHVSAAIYCIGLFILSTVFLGFVFIPKMVAFAKDPKGENIFARTKTFTVNSTHESNGRRPTLETTDGTMMKHTDHSMDTEDDNI